MALRRLTLLGNTIHWRLGLRSPGRQLLSLSGPASSINSKHMMTINVQQLTVSTVSLQSRRFFHGGTPNDKLTAESTDEEVISETQMDEQEASEAINNLSPEDDYRLRVLQVEYEVLTSMGERMPSQMTDERWLHLLRVYSDGKGSRAKLYRYWARKEYFKEKKAKAAKVRAKRHEARQESRPKDLDKSVVGKHMMLFVQENTMVKHYYNNLAHAMVHGIPLVFDLGFENQLAEREVKEATKQVRMAFAINKIAPDPFHFHLTSVAPGSMTEKYLTGAMPGLNKIPMTVTEQSYLELFPKKNLVYLSPNAPRELQNFNANDVYIIGGIVDVHAGLPRTYAKAKEQGIRAAKFPIDSYLRWRIGTKALTLDQVTKIMQEMKCSNDWRQAFCHIPKRKFDWY